VYCLLQLSCCPCVPLCCFSCLFFFFLCCGLRTIVLSWPIACPFVMARVIFMYHGLFDIQVLWSVKFSCAMACMLFKCRGQLSNYVPWRCTIAVPWPSQCSCACGDLCAWPMILFRSVTGCAKHHFCCFCMNTEYVEFLFHCTADQQHDQHGHPHIACCF